MQGNFAKNSPVFTRPRGPITFDHWRNVVKHIAVL